MVSVGEWGLIVVTVFFQPIIPPANYSILIGPSSEEQVVAAQFALISRPNPRRGMGEGWVRAALVLKVARAVHNQRSDDQHRRALAPRPRRRHARREVDPKRDAAHHKDTRGE